MNRAVLAVLVMTTVSKILGFGREIVLSYVYGASAVTDAYLISRTVPNVLFAFLGSAIGTSFIPLYSRILKEQGELEANEFTNNLSNSLVLLASAMLVIVLLFTEPVVRLFASGFSGETLRLAVNFTRISVFGAYFTILLSVFTGFLKLRGNFFIPASVALPMNLIVVASVFISSETNVYVLVIGSLLATASQLIFLIPAVRKTGYRHRFVFDLKDDRLRTMMRLALPVIAGTSVNQINILVDRTLASGVAVGAISALNYAQRLNGFVQALFVAPISTVLYPTISRMAAEGNIKGLKRSMLEAISSVNFFLVPATVGALVFSKEIVGLLFGRGAFTPEAINMTTAALFYYSFGMIAVGVRGILSRAFYALQDTRTPMVNGTIGVIINILLNIILSRYLGIGGLALATSISAAVTAILMFASLRRKIGGFGLKAIALSFGKISVASVMMGLIVLSSYGLFKKVAADNVALILAVCTGVVSYAVFIYFLKVPVAVQMIKTFRTWVEGRRGKG
jgi:putative peptidoglycan lipid II flippase